MPKRFYSLDALRGVAALGVVFWHWQHFFYTGTHKADFDRARQPFYGLFYLFYEKGWMAVDLFFSLSGFIFFWLYARRIESRRIGAGEFSMLRLSRLYPLHLATLLFVAATQWWIHSRTGDYVVYPLNGMQQFLAHLLFVSGWRSSWADSFNAPVWSVSVEVFLYGTFFALFRVFRRRTIPLIALVVLGAVLKFHIPIGRGIYSFFLGGLAYYAFSELRARGLISRVLKPLALLAILGWVAVVVGLRIEVVRDWSQSSVDALGRATNLLATGVLMPLTLLVLAMTETAKRGPWKRISFLGDISYSSYMLHFPLQLAVVAVATATRLPKDIFYSRLALVAFFIVLIVVSAGSFHYFERPVQDWIRGRWRARGHTSREPVPPATAALKNES